MRDDRAGPNAMTGWPALSPCDARPAGKRLGCEAALVPKAHGVGTDMSNHPP